MPLVIAKNLTNWLATLGDEVHIAPARQKQQPSTATKRR